MLETKVSTMNIIFFHLDTILLYYYYNAVMGFFHGHKEIDDLTALEV